MNSKISDTNKKKLSPAKKLMIASALLIIAALVQHLVLDLVGFQARQDMLMVDTEIGVSYGFDAHASFYSSGARHFFFAARDGVQNISSTGDLRWQHGFTLSQPLMVGRGDKIAIGERDGHRIYVFGPDGYLYSINLPNPAMYFTVNPTGYLSVIMRTDTGYIVQVFNPANPHDPSYGYRAPRNDANLFPMSVDVSECGTYIATAYFDVDTWIFAKITFGYLRRVDSRGMPDGLFRLYNYADEFIYRVRFTGCGRVIALTDRRILGFESGRGSSGYIWDIILNNRPDPIYIGQNRLAFVTGEPFINHPDAESPGILKIYDFNGQETGRYDLGRRATYLTVGHNTILAGMDRTFFAISPTGNRLWTHLAIQDIHDAVFLENTDTILLAGGTRASIWRRIRV